MSIDKGFPKYCLVLFTENELHKEVDVVPASWLTYDKKKQTCFCKCMPKPYDMCKFKQLQAMVKGCEDPLPKWSDYPVEIRGRAKNYKEALERLKILKTEPYAYTTANEESARCESQKDVPSQLSKVDSTKSIFKTTAFYDCVVDTMRKKLKSRDGDELSNKEILDAMSSTLRNSRDWDGHRLLRINKFVDLLEN